MPVTTTYKPPQRATIGFTHKLQPGETHHELKQRSFKHVESAHELAYLAGLGCKGKDLLQSSFTDEFPFYIEHEARAIQPSTNGFIFSCVNAYFDHKHLIIRPDDVWLAILMQLNMYIQANAEKLRSKFVAHKGKKELVIDIRGQTKSEDNPLQFAEFAQKMTHKMQDNVKDPELREWVMPSFTTTTELDRVVASITFMGALSEYFDYGGLTSCGIPYVRLEGEKGDWETMLAKISKIKSFGEEAVAWHNLLHPILTHFVEMFESPGSKSIKNFWQTIVHHDVGGSGQPNHFSGWITAFSFWDKDGKCLWPKGKSMLKKMDRHLSLKGVVYPRMKVRDVVQVYNINMVAGALAIRHESSEDVPGRLDTIAPMQGWFVYFAGNVEDPCKPEQTFMTKKKGKSVSKNGGCADDVWEGRKARWEEMEVMFDV